MPPHERSNDEWLADLRGPNRDAALADLRAVLLRGLRFALDQSGNLRDTDLEDFAQEALLRILDNLDSFRGESRFTTWAHKIAVRVAFSELRRRRWKDVSLDEWLEQSEGDFTPQLLADENATPEEVAVQQSLLDAIARLMRDELTERQRKALVLVAIRGVPMEEVARRMNTNRNALYKLLHDARKRLKQAMAREGINPQEVMQLFERTP
ncbi:RNA polymerase sigma factor [Ardenticatena maritima]|uniref:RNA polymerase sigma-70 factor, ECF subfamily n=1 Tax=Ardenticatena maritima TaxID=872965 RepID=A0A0P6YG63_9CHLR|nr:sigma-70 family RNA polymerase sigma factor [Ardenticatena maritima]KPL89353.1 hypothetical protein SE16_02525 [Ardenticatena maritima]